MATVYLKRGTWYAGFRAADGKRRNTATKAQTKTEARKLAAEMEMTAERQRLGLEPLPSDSSLTLAELSTWWLGRWCPQASRKREQSRLDRYVIEAPLGGLPMREVTSAVLDDRFRELLGNGLQGITVARIRGTLRTVINRARKQGVWQGSNPVTATTAPSSSPKVRDVLTVDESERLLRYVPARWRGYFAVLAYLGVRPSDGARLCKADVDVERLTLVVRQSKTGREAVLPIPAVLWPHVETGLRTPGPHLFPGENGALRLPKTAAVRVLKRASVTLA